MTLLDSLLKKQTFNIGLTFATHLQSVDAGGRMGILAKIFGYLHHRSWMRRLCFHPCLFVWLKMISQKVVDWFGRNLVDRLGVWRGRIDLILVKIWIWIRPISGIQNVNCSAWWRYALYRVPSVYYCDCFLFPFSSAICLLINIPGLGVNSACPGCFVWWFRLVTG